MTQQLFNLKDTKNYGNKAITTLVFISLLLSSTANNILHPFFYPKHFKTNVRFLDMTNMTFHGNLYWCDDGKFVCKCYNFPIKKELRWIFCQLNLPFSENIICHGKKSDIGFIVESFPI